MMNRSHKISTTRGSHSQSINQRLSSLSVSKPQTQNPTSSQFPLIIRPGNSRTHKRKAQRSTKSEWQIHTTENLFLSGLLPFFSTMILQSEITPCNVCVGRQQMCVEMMIFAQIYRYDLCPMGRQMAKGRKSSSFGFLCKRASSHHSVRYHRDDYLFMFLRTRVAFSPPHSLVSMCLRLRPKKTFPNIDCLSLFNQQGLWSETEALADPLKNKSCDDKRATQSPALVMDGNNF